MTFFLDEIKQIRGVTSIYIENYHIYVTVSKSSSDLKDYEKTLKILKEQKKYDWTFNLIS